MYNSLKRIAKLVVPKKLLQKHASFFRRLISLRYKGKNHKCNICNFGLSHFVQLNNNDLLCPNCGSRSRTRQLYELVKNGERLNGNVLHFSPTRALYRKFKTLNINYFSSDFENEFTADHNYDITSIPVDSDYFDTIICYHILEHIENDTKAMSELFRVLKPSGLCYIQTPYKTGNIYEDHTITTPQARLNAFGQEDHVRVYSVEGLKQRLKQVGFKVEVKNFKKDFYHGIKNETVIFTKK